MIISIGGRDMMLILIVAALSLIFVYLLWPKILEYAIKHKPYGGGETWGGRLIIVGVLVLIAIYCVLVLPDSERSWMDTEPAVSAVLITAAIFFTYSRFLPSSFYGAFQEVTDFTTGAWNPKRLTEITIEKSKVWPIFLVVHNTGIVSWNNYRITADFGNDFEAYWERDDFPSSKIWSWKTNKLRIGKKPCWVQVQATNVLAIGEPQTMRFLVKADKVGKFKLIVSVVSDNRPGERHQTLWINVNEGERNGKETSEIETRKDSEQKSIS